MSLAYLFKQVYKPNEINDLAAVGRPFLGMVPKNKMGGKNMTHLWKYARPAGVSNTFSVSLAQQDQQSVGVQLITQPSQKYSIFRLDAKEAAASLKGDAYAYASTKKNELNDRIDDVYTQLDIDLHGAGNGVLGQVTAINGLVLSMDTTAYMNRFFVGQRLINVTDATPPVDGTQPTVGNALMVVTGVNFQQRTITVDNTGGLAVSNYLTLQGDPIGFSATNFYGTIIGMGAWVPTTDPSLADNFLGVINRNQDVARLTGIRTPANGLTARDAILLNAALVYELGGKPDVVLVHPTDWQRMAIELQTQVRYEPTQVGKISFETLMLNGPAGKMMRVMSDPHQQRSVARLLTMDSWELYSVGDLVDLSDDDGLSALRDSNADAFQMRVRSWPQLRCFDPHANGVVTGI